MPIVALFRWRGDADALVAAYDRELLDPPAVTLEQPRRKLHVFAHGDNGAVVIDLWETEEDFRRMVDAADFKQNVAASNWPSEPEIAIYHIHATMP
jgi:hypothetical protein